MTFANPWVLALLLLIPLIIFLSINRGHQSNLSISVVGHDKPFSNIFDKLGFYLPFILRLASVAIIIIALARPQFGQSYTTSKNLGVDMMIAVDTSQSMAALDMTWGNKHLNRLTIVKEILRDFVLKRSNDRLGLLVFGEQAYTQCPLTTDHGAIIDLLGHVSIGMVGDSTAIGSAIAVAVKRLKDLKAKSKILILMTDGQNTSGTISPMTASKLAKEYGIKVYTIGIGRSGEVPFAVDTPIGQRIVNQEVIMDEDTLIEIAESTGGQYFRAENTQALKKIYDHIDKLEKSEVEVKQYNSYRDVFEKFLWIAFILFLLEILLGGTVLFRIN